jgi:hypothetical protein
VRPDGRELAGVCVRVRLVRSAGPPGEVLDGELVIENRSDRPASFTQPDACRSIPELRRDGAVVGPEAPACAQVFVGEVRVEAGTSLRSPLSISLTRTDGSPLAPGSYQLVVRVHTSAADGRWETPPAGITVG